MQDDHVAMDALLPPFVAFWNKCVDKRFQEGGSK
jgi:hypothetical protein